MPTFHQRQLRRPTKSSCSFLIHPYRGRDHQRNTSAASANAPMDTLPNAAVVGPAPAPVPEMPYPTLSDLRKTLNQSATRDDLPDNGIQSRRRVCDRAPRHARDFDLSTRVSGKEFLTRIEQTKVPLCKSRLSRERNGTRRARSLRRSARNLRTCRAATDHKLNCHVVKNGVQVGVNKRDALYIHPRPRGPSVNTPAPTFTQSHYNGS